MLHPPGARVLSCFTKLSFFFIKNFLLTKWIKSNSNVSFISPTAVTRAGFKLPEALQRFSWGSSRQIVSGSCLTLLRRWGLKGPRRGCHLTYRVVTRVGRIEIRAWINWSQTYTLPELSVSREVRLLMGGNMIPEGGAACHVSNAHPHPVQCGLSRLLLSVAPQLCRKVWGAPA